MLKTPFCKIKEQALSLSHSFFQSFGTKDLMEKAKPELGKQNLEALKQGLEQQDPNRICIVPFLPKFETAEIISNSYPHKKIIFLETQNTKGLDFFSNNPALNELRKFQNLAYLGGSYYPEIHQYLPDYNFLSANSPKIIKLIEKFKNHRILIFGSGTLFGHGLTSSELFLNLKRLGLNVNLISLWKIAQDNIIEGLDPEAFKNSSSEDLSKNPAVQKVISEKILQFDPDLFLSISEVCLSDTVKRSLEKCYCPSIYWEVENFNQNNYKDLEPYIDIYGSYQKNALNQVSCSQKFFMPQGFFYPEKINLSFEYNNPKSYYFCGMVTEKRAVILLELIKNGIEFDLFGVWNSKVAKKFPELSQKFINNPLEFIYRQDYFAIIKKGNIALNFCDHGTTNPRFFEVPALGKVQLPSKVSHFKQNQDFFENYQGINTFLNNEENYFKALKQSGFNQGLEQSYAFKLLSTFEKLGY